MRTYIPKDKDIKREWRLIDAEGHQIGRLATQIADVLRGKHRPIFTPHLDTGDFVVVVNAGKIVFTGDKLNQKTYFRHSMYPGGGKVTSLRQAMERKPEWVVRKTVWGMMPHNSLGRRLIKKLKVYRGPEHPHKAQEPVEWISKKGSEND